MMNVGMRPFYRMLMLAVFSIALAAVPASASATAQISTDRTCYLETPQTTVTVSGSGFAPNTQYTAALDGGEVGGDKTNDQGAMQAAIKPPALADDVQQQRFTLSVAAADQTATTAFTLTRFAAGFAPTKGDPAKLRVRFSAYGFGLAGDHPTVWLHYVAPDGKLVKTLRLGRAQGACGTIERTAKRRLFPFAHPRDGKWRLQFDTSKRYRRGVKGSRFLFYTVGVSVQAASASPRGSAAGLGGR
jgi:hypothetical protein